ncbi:MAG TPA: efflux RND transporter periplasmic adaptor subunit [Rhizomicrobium sp.]|jgi:multidrug efflux system membrane fusion protein|nr:efflux RND transporter periplasmic adaptor subunit [Rhizomicrobium sp.]
MSHISHLISSEKLKTGAVPLGGSKLLRNKAFLAAAAFVFLAVTGFAGYHAGATPAPATGPAAIPVTVAAVDAKPVRLWSEFSGRMAAVNSADIRPQVGGRITEIRFKDGQEVHAGDILFVIDPRPYEAAVAKAQADLATAQTNARLAKTEVDRATRLVAQNAIARDYYDQRVNASGVAAAAIQSAQATLVQANLDVDHAYVKAPISGRVSRAEITVGNLVQTSPAPLLTSIVSDNGIYADFDVDEQTYMQSVRAHATTAAQEQKIPVELSVQGDNGHVYKGTIESFDNQIATGTGTIRARARFANTDGALVPGMFASVRLASAANSKAILVPEDAIGSDQSKRFVFVVGHDRKAAFREVALGQEVGGNRVVLSGLHSGERVIVDGLQRVQPGAAVDPHFASLMPHRKFAAR